MRSEDRDWEGAIERLMHSFGLSLLVPDADYARVAQWVDRTHLGERLVYFRVLSHRAADVQTSPAAVLRRRARELRRGSSQARAQARFPVLRLAGKRDRSPF